MNKVKQVSRRFEENCRPVYNARKQAREQARRMRRMFYVEQNLMSMTVAQLRDIAKANGVKLPSKATKDKIVKTIMEPPA